MQVFLLFLSLFFFACQNKAAQPNTGKAETKERPSPSAPFRLLSAQEAQPLVCHDAAEGFFERVQPLELAIQMRRTLEDLQKEENILESYREMLKADLRNFSAQEAKFAQEAMQEALKDYQSLLPLSSLPSEVLLIKTQGEYYGPTVYYTRDSAIIIPAPQLQGSSKEALTRVLIHELFHIYSRYNPEKRKALYKRIGFELIDSLELSSFLQKRVLYNPDGVVLNYAITIQDEQGKDIKAIPAIFSKFNDYSPEKAPSFFAYLEFRVFPIEEKSSGIFQVVEPTMGYDPRQSKSFLKQIADNTAYIIHPDEVLADNFVLLAQKSPRNNFGQPLSPEGKQLMEDIRKIIQAPLD